MTGDNYTYNDSSAPTSARIEDLLERMTIEEKAGQLTGMWVGKFSTTDSSANAGGLVEQTLSDVEDAIRTSNIGSVTPFGTGISSYNNPAVTSRIANQLQRVARNETRLGVPLIIPVDAIHGHANVDGSTIFPHNLGMAATWDPKIVKQSAQITAKEMRATGATQNYSPTADVARDPRWGERTKPTVSRHIWCRNWWQRRSKDFRTERRPTRTASLRRQNTSRRTAAPSEERTQLQSISRRLRYVECTCRRSSVLSMKGRSVSCHRIIRSTESPCTDRDGC